MTIPAPGRVGVVGRIVVIGLAAFVSGCATRGVVAPCGDVPILMELGTNVVLVPPRTPASGPAVQAGSQVAEGLQLAAAASFAELHGVKVVRLVEPAGQQARCEPAVLEYEWSGCSPSLGRPVLISKEPVFLLWANLIPDGDKALFHFNASMWRIDASELVALEFRGREGSKTYRFEAWLPLRKIAFQPRVLSVRDVEELAGGMNILSEPRAGASPITRGIQGSFRVVEVAERNRSKWLNVQLADNRRGWLPLNAAQAVGKLFPELLFLEVAVGYFEYMRRDVTRDAQFVEDALKRFVAQADPQREGRAIGLAYALAGMVALFEGARTNQRSYLAAAHGHFERAVAHSPEDAEVRNLLLLTTLGRCCVDLYGDVDVQSRRLRSALPMRGTPLETVSATRLAIDTFKSAQTNVRAASNLIGMLKRLEEIDALPKFDIKGLISSLEDLLASQADSQPLTQSCEAIRPRTLLP